MNYESEKVEFKLTATDDIYKEVVAFANSTGGTILIGVDDDGSEIGVELVDEVYTRVTNGIRDAIQPDVTMFVKYELRENRVICVTVGEGSAKPYFLKSKGLKPSGVYVRQGASSVQASFDQIRAMIRDTDGDHFEAMRSLEQDLTFTQAAQAFTKYGVAFDASKYAALGMIRPDDGLFTNLALLMSDQCRHTVKAAAFADEANTVFRDAKEFGGSVFKQLDDAYQFLSLCNRTVSAYQGLERVEKRDYPDEALREGLLNALVHRDYSYSGSIIINVNDRAIEFISLGGLLPGLTAEDIKSGISQPRNRAMAEVFHRLRLIESYGTGLRRIWALYSGCSEQPRIELTPNTFKLVLPNMNAAVAAASPAVQPSDAKRLSAQESSILEYIKQHGSAGEEEIQHLLNVKRTRAYTLLRGLVEAGLLVAEGRGAGKRFIRSFD